MLSDLPELYFRIRDNGAHVFRVGSDPRLKRLELEQIASVNLRSDEVRPHGERSLDGRTLALIRDWMTERRALLAERERAEVQATIESLNGTTQWLNAKASDAEVVAVCDGLMLAMHDLRSTLLRRRAEMAQSEPEGLRPEALARSRD